MTFCALSSAKGMDIKMSIRNIIDSNIIESAVSGMVIYFFGDWDFLLKAILVLVILDFITGWIKPFIIITCHLILDLRG